MGLENRPDITTTRSLTEFLDRQADAAWPAAERQSVGPWVLRAASGVTQRANSVLTSGHAMSDSCDVRDWIASAEAFYADRWLPVIFYLSPAAVPTNLSPELEQRGYQVKESAEVWTAPADRLTQPAESDNLQEIALSDRPDSGWIDCAFDEPIQRRRVHQQIVQSITRQRVFASIRRDKLTVACGLAVSAQGWTGIFCMHTHPAHRRQGHAAAILATLAHWSIQQNAPQMYLQMVADNLRAKSLYQRCGFQFAYPFHFRSKSQMDSPDVR
ncbi:MAG: GNAT family N-acetyltransferase [Phycisphaerales bacterium]|jgi:GNAT superfamily N-acetyltransferase|nr:GNAT family N-acetyltransferase [Phycisphaerales bacterium]